MPKIATPAELLCPLTLNLMMHPVMTIDGDVYERIAIEAWLQYYDTNPRTNKSLTSKQLMAVPFINQQIQKFLSDHHICSSTQFLAAVKSGSVQNIKRLNYIDSYLTDSAAGVARLEHGQPLSLAAQNGHIEMMAFLLEAGALIDGKDGFGRTALHWAALRGRVDAAKWLLQHNADINRQDDNDGSTPLHFAVLNGHFSVVETLLKAGAKIESLRRRDNCTPLHIAAEKGFESIVRLLLMEKADIKAKRNDGNTPLHVAASGWNSFNILPLLQAAGADVNARNKFYRTPLHLAADNQGAEAVTYLFKHEADINAKDTFGQTSLHIAVANIVKLSRVIYPREEELKRCWDMIHVLIKAEANYQAVDNEGRTAVMLADEQSRPKLEALIYEHMRYKNALAHSLTPQKNPPEIMTSGFRPFYSTHKSATNEIPNGDKLQLLSKFSFS